MGTIYIIYLHCCRYNIIKDVGSALVYLHNECNPSILHRDIKPSNVLLDFSFNAKLSDFGLSRSCSQSNQTFATRAAGTIGYLDPECIKRNRVSTKSDVYSFGVMMLELSYWGKSPEQIWDLYRRGMIIQAVDMRLEKNFDKRQLQCVAVVGLWCAHPDGTQRPSILQAMEVLQFRAPLPAEISLNTIVAADISSNSCSSHATCTSASGGACVSSSQDGSIELQEYCDTIHLLNPR